MPRSAAARAAASRRKSGRPCEIGFAVENERVGLLVREDVLDELRAERREPLGDRREPRFFASAASLAPARTKSSVIALEHARLFGRQPELVACFASGRRRAEQRLVHDRSRCDAWRESGAISRSIACMASLVCAPVEIEEDAADPLRGVAPLRSSASIVLAKVGAAGSAAIASISARCSRERRVEGRPIMLGGDRLERRDAAWIGPDIEERIAPGRGCDG